MSHYLFSTKPHGVMKNGEKINTRVHYEYICRQGRYAKLDGRKEDLVYMHSGNLPVWACNSPGEFWQQAEAQRGQNGNGYREILLGLQEELSLEANIALVEELLEKTGIGKDHVFTYAIHDKEAAFDKDHRNIHCHLMFNEKLLEQDRPLEAAVFFKRYSVNKNNEPTQGYRTDRRFQNKAELKKMRQLWENIVNAKLAENGIEARVDSRTLAEQHAEKIAAGEYDEAKYYDRIPARHLGKAFQNPKLQRELREQCAQNLQAALHGQDCVYPEPVDSFETKKMLFMRDFVVRKTAKIILAAKKAQLAKARKIADYVQRQERQKEALVVTNTDIICYEEENIAALKTKITGLDSDYRARAAQLISERRSLAKAMYEVFGSAYSQNKNNPAQIKIYRQDPLVLAKTRTYMQTVYVKLATLKVLGEDYTKLIQQYNKARAEKRELIKAYEEIKLKLYENRTPELLEQRESAYRKLQANNRATHVLAEQLQAYKDAAKRPENKQLIEANALKLEAQNEANKLALKEIYKEKIKVQSALQQAETILGKAKELPQDTVLFADKISPLATVETKLYGKIKLGSLELVNIANDTFCLLPGENAAVSFKAVKLLDDIQRGKLTVYTVSNTGKEAKNGADSSYSVKRTSEKIPVYRVKDQVALTPALPLDQGKKNAIKKFLQDALKTENINLIPVWPEVDTAIVDELERELEQDKVANYLRL